jgi:hypothetical protein
MASSPTLFNADVIVQTHYYQDGFVTVNFEWGSYNGSFIQGKAHGFGVQTMSRSIPGALPTDQGNAIYRGDWKAGQRNGYGRLEIPWLEKVYEGGWRGGRASGFGKSITMKKGWADEWEETGFKDGLAHGWGVTRVTGSSNPSESAWYSGGYKRGQRNGYYVRYTGELAQHVSVKDGIPHGYQTTKRGNIVQSREFVLEGRPHAQPTFQFAPDWLPSSVAFNPYAARFQDGTHSFNATVDLQNGDRYNGNLSYGNPHGYGLLNCSVAHRHPGVYDGGWKYGFACGFGVWTGSDGNRYEGGWHNGKPFGYGQVTALGTTFDTFWEDGMGWRFNEPWIYGQGVGAFRMPSPPKPQRTMFI